MALIGLCFVVGLLFFGRPYLLRLMHQYAVGGARRVPGARQAWRAINRQLGPSGQRIGLPVGLQLTPIEARLYDTDTAFRTQP